MSLAPKWQMPPPSEIHAIPREQFISIRLRARECERGGSSLFFHCFISNVGGCVCGGSSSTVSSGMVELTKMQYYFNSKSISISRLLLLSKE